MFNEVEYMKEYRIKNKEKLNRQCREYHAKNYPIRREEICKKVNEYRIKNAEKIQKSRDADKERTNLRDKEYYKNHPEKRYEKWMKWARSPKGKIYLKMRNHNERTQRKSLTVQLIQMVYEDNIKRNGTLTCYLCLCQIPFGKDHLEHKVPLSRGGSNEYQNLDVACQSCNSHKYNKTEEEYRKGRK